MLRLNVEAPQPDDVDELVASVRSVLAGGETRPAGLDNPAGLDEPTGSLLPEGLLEIMQCPACAGELSEVMDPPSLLCGGCGLRYPVEDGISIMLIEEATQT